MSNTPNWWHQGSQRWSCVGIYNWTESFVKHLSNMTGGTLGFPLKIFPWKIRKQGKKRSSPWHISHSITSQLWLLHLQTLSLMGTSMKSQAVKLVCVCCSNQVRFRLGSILRVVRWKKVTILPHLSTSLAVTCDVQPGRAASVARRVLWPPLRDGGSDRIIWPDPAEWNEVREGQPSPLPCSLRSNIIAARWERCGLKSNPPARVCVRPRSLSSLLIRLVKHVTLSPSLFTTPSPSEINASRLYRVNETWLPFCSTFCLRSAPTGNGLGNWSMATAKLHSCCKHCVVNLTCCAKLKDPAHLPDEMRRRSRSILR